MKMVPLQITQQSISSVTLSTKVDKFWLKIYESETPGIWIGLRKIHGSPQIINTFFITGGQKTRKHV